MPNLLKLTKLSKVHLVDKGAAVSPRVLVIKRANRAEEDPMSVDQAKLAEAISKAVAGAVSAVLKEGVTAEMTPQQLLEQALMPIKDEATRAAILAAVAAMHQAPPAAPVAPEKAEPEPPKDEPVPSPPKEEPDTVKRDKAVAEVLKGMKPEERAVIEAELAARDDKIEKGGDIAKRLETAEEEIAKGVARDELAEQIAVAKSFPFVPGDVKKRAGVLLSVKKADDGAYKEMVEQMKSANELIKKGDSLKGRGTSRFPGDDGSDDDDEKTGHEKLKEMAESIVEKSVEKADGKPITYEVAYARATKAHPEWLAQAHRETQIH